MVLTKPGAFSAIMASLILTNFFAATAPSTAAPNRTDSFSLGNATGHPALQCVITTIHVKQEQ
jgi:hypothetical protein